MILYNGCSFVWGAELEKNEEFRFSTRLSKRIGMKHKNIALPGGSNERMLRTTINEITHNPDSYKLVVLGFTNEPRFEVWDYVNNYYIPSWIFRKYDEDKPLFGKVGGKLESMEYQFFPKLREPRLKDLMPTYKEMFLAQSNTFFLLNKFTIILKSLISFLEHRNIPYYFFNSMRPLDFDNHALLYRRLDTNTKNIISKKYDNLESWTCWQSKLEEKKIGGGLKPGWHPDEVAHTVWSSYLYDKITTLYGDSLH